MARQGHIFGSRRHALKEISDAAQEILGEGWAAWRFALYAAQGLTYIDDVSFNDESASLTARASSAWANRNSVPYWRDQFGHGIRKENRTAFIAALINWAPSNVIAEIGGQIVEEWERLSSWEILSIRRFGDSITQKDTGKIAASLKLNGDEILETNLLHQSPCMGTAFEARLGERSVKKVYEVIGNVSPCARHFDVDSAFRLSRLLKTMSLRRTSDSLLGDVAELYSHARAGLIYFDGANYASFIRRMTAERAAQVLSSPDRFPLFLLTSAEQKMSSETMDFLPSLSQSARTGNWF